MGSTNRTAILGLAALAAACAGASRSPASAIAVGPEAAKAKAKADSARWPYTEADIRFMSTMIHHHAQAIVMATWAPTHGASTEVRTLCGRIINARVVIHDHKIAEVSLDDDRVPMPEGARVEDLRGKFLIPGLFDSHVHWGGSGGIGLSPIERTPDRLSHDLEATLDAGVTSVVSLTDNIKEMRALSNEVASGKKAAPRTF